MRLIKEKTSIDFLGRARRTVAMCISAVFIIVAIASLATKALEFGIDFTGGVLLEVGYPQAADLESIRTSLRDEGFDSNIQACCDGPDESGFAAGFDFVFVQPRFIESFDVQ